jgi:hypothetical protein
LCENTLAEAMKWCGREVVGSVGPFAELGGFLVLESLLIEFPAVMAACSRRRTPGVDYALMAARSGRTPMMFMTRVKL